MNTSFLTPFSYLDPDLILDAVESAGFFCSGNLLALNSYENRVYQVGLEDAAPLIIKFYRPERWTNEAILEEHQFALELFAQEIPVVAPLINEKGETLHHYQNFRFALFPRKGGRPLEIDQLDQLEWMGRYMGRLHATGACRRFQYREQFSVKLFGYDAYQFLLNENFIPSYLKENFCRAVESILEKIIFQFERFAPLNFIRLHGDCHAGNVLWNEGPQIVDLDDCIMGPAIQDIWMLLSGNSEQMNIQFARILDGYEEFYDFNPQEFYLIEALRTLRMLHYSAWLAKRWQDPAFPLNFPWFNTPRYWQELLQNINEQHELLEF